MRTINALRAEGRRQLKDGCHIDVDVLLMHILQIDKNTMLTNPERLVDEDDATEFSRLIALRYKNTPTQYLTGKCEFMSLIFMVDKSVLIPRPDTEILVETVLANETSGVGLEIGVGSGCVSISLEYYAKGIIMHGVDISRVAVRVAGQNHQRLLNCKSRFFVSDLFENVPLGTLYDFVVSNPPYIETQEIGNLAENVKGFEPKIALDGGTNGLKFYRRICEKVGDYLTAGGRIYFEIGHNQSVDVKHILCRAGFSDVHIVKDLAGRDRVMWGKKV